MTNNLLNIFILLIYLALLVLISMLKTKNVPGRAIMLFRGLFPSWRFFEDLCYLPILYYRTSLDGLNFNEWEIVIKKTKRNWKNIFLNSEGNLLHAYHSLLLQLESDKEEVTEENKNNFIQSVSYQLTKNLVTSKILNNNYSASTLFYQFKLCSEMQGNLDDKEDILVSITHQL